MSGVFGQSEKGDKVPRKAAKARYTLTVPQTDTGSRGEKPKVLE